MTTRTLHLVGSLARIFPPMAPEEFTRLLDSVRSDGLLEDIAVWQGVVIDGYHRLRACLLCGTEPRFHHLPEDADPLGYVIAKNAHRRTLDATSRAAAAFKASRWSTPGRPARSGGNRANLHGFLPRAAAAASFGVSPRSVATVARILDSESGAVAMLRLAVESGAVTANDAAALLREPPELQEMAVAMVRSGDARTLRRAVNRILRDRQSDYESHPPAQAGTGSSITLHAASVAQLHTLVPEGSVDAVITFPPPADDFPPLAELAGFAAHALRQSGGLFLLADSRHLPRLFETLQHPELNWLCAFGYRHPGRPARLGRGLGVSLTHKLLLIFGKREFHIAKGEDLIVVPPFGENEAGNPLSPRLGKGMELILERLTRPGQMVCDPFLLSRNDLVLAALRLGRSFTGAWEDRAFIDRLRRDVAVQTRKGAPAG